MRDDAPFNDLLAELKTHIGFADADATRLGAERPLPDSQGELAAWRRALLGDLYDTAHFARAAEIGRAYAQRGLSAAHLVGVVARTRADGAGLEAASQAAFAKLLDLELAVMTDAFHRARDAQRETQRLATVDRLAAGLAHEIRNPLNGAQLHLALLRRALGPTVAPEAHDALRVVDAETRRLGRLVTDFLDFAKPQTPVPDRIDLRESVLGVVRAFEARAASCGVRLVADLPPESVVLTADVRRLDQALANLVENAVEVLGRGGGHVTVRARAAPDGAWVEVEDDGPGFAKEAPVFEPFYSTKSSGTGLGLAIVRRVATDHGGAVSIDRASGRTRIRMSLPLGQREEWR